MVIICSIVLFPIILFVAQFVTYVVCIAHNISVTPERPKAALPAQRIVRSRKMMFNVHPSEIER